VDNKHHQHLEIHHQHMELLDQILEYIILLAAEEVLIPVVVRPIHPLLEVLEVVVMCREGMGCGAPVTRQHFERLVELARETMPHLTPLFRSDLDGAIPAGT